VARAHGDWDSFVKMLQELLVPQNAQQYGVNGRRYIEENHNIVGIATLYKQIFRQLTKGLSAGDCNDNN
jgi:hypothetical protein